MMTVASAGPKRLLCHMPTLDRLCSSLPCRITQSIDQAIQSVNDTPRTEEEEFQATLGGFIGFFFTCGVFRFAPLLLVSKIDVVVHVEQRQRLRWLGVPSSVCKKEAKVDGQDECLNKDVDFGHFAMGSLLSGRPTLSLVLLVGPKQHRPSCSPS